METIYLHGSEDVRTAGARIGAAAEEMKHAANLIDDALMRHQRFLDDWLYRFTEAIEKARVAATINSVAGE